MQSSVLSEIAVISATTRTCRNNKLLRESCASNASNKAYVVFCIYISVFIVMIRSIAVVFSFAKEKYIKKCRFKCYEAY